MEIESIGNVIWTCNIDYCTYVEGQQCFICFLYDINRYIYLDLLFHTELCKLAGNDYLEKFYREVNLHLNMTFIYRIGIPPDVQESFADHEQIAQKLAENSSASLELLEDHLERSRGHIIQGELFRSLE